jgi:AcrR family transcriptional regulator
MNERSRRPTAATIVPRLLDAVEVLCARLPPSDVTMRAIAKEAGLSYGAAYRYFESRDALLGAAMERMGERIAAASARHDDPVEAMAAMWQVLRDNPAFPRLVTSLAMSGRTVREVMSKNPLARNVATKAAEQGMPDPAAVAGITLLLAIGGSMYGPTINSAVQRDPDDRGLYDAVGEMFALWLDKQSTAAIDD